MQEQEVKKALLDEIGKNLNLESLKILAELSKKPGVDAKLKTKYPLIKTFL
jgi:hypothetical protein